MSHRTNAAEKSWKTRRKNQEKRVRAAKKAWENRRFQWRNLRRSILLVECIPESDIDCSEGKMLKELFRIIKLQMKDNRETVDWVPARANSPERLLEILEKAEQSCIHISCHGQYYKNYKKTGLKLPEGRLFSDQISSSRDSDIPLWGERLDNYEPVPQLIFLSACETAHVTDLCEKFMQAGARYVIAPEEETPFSDAALFSSIFYTLVFVEKKNPRSAYKKTIKAFPRMAGKWKFYDGKTHRFKYA